MKRRWQMAFLECLKVDGRETRCAEFVGKSRVHVYRTKRRDPEFAEEVKAALAAYESSLVEGALTRQRRHAAATR